MGMIRRLEIVLAMAGLLCAGSENATGRQTGQRSQPEPKSVPEYSISGIVIDTATGNPVGHALVVLAIYEAPRTQGGEHPMRRVMTDDEGKFEFRGLTVIARAGIEASKPGYHSAREIRLAPGHTMNAFQELTVEPGADVKITLKPEATIAGRVVDENGEPIERLPVHLTFEAARDGRRTLQEVGRGVPTNEEGEFRFADLQSGRYFVSAGPSEEVSSRPSERGRTAMGYATTFYGGGSDFATASPIDLIAGKHADLDLRMQLQPLLKVSGFISGIVGSVSPRLTIFDSANQRVVNMIPKKSDQELQIAELPEGSYTIRARSVDPIANQCAATVKRLNLKTDVSGLQIALVPCATIPVTVHVEYAQQDSKKTASVLDENGVVRTNRRYLAQAVLRPNDERGMLPTFRAGTEKDDPDKAILRGVEPGRYILEVPLMRGMYAESMQSGMIDLLREDLVVAPGATVAPVEVQLRDDAAMLDGKVKLGPDVSAAAVIAIPEQALRAATALVVSGQFQFRPLAPGRYRLFAVDRVDDFAYAEQDVIGKYLAHAKEVTLRPNERTTVELEFVRVGREEQQ